MHRILAISAILVFFIASSFLPHPSFNGTTPGCSGSGCHTLEDGIVQATPLNNGQISVLVSGVQSGKPVAGELVDASGQVVDVIEQTNTNPFVLTAPGDGDYRVNAGFKKPSRKWDSTMVHIMTTGIRQGAYPSTPLRFELFPNHPNPFNNTTLIRFSLPTASKVQVKIFNVRGQVVRHLTQQYFRAGIHTLRWNGVDDAGRTCASGIYLCQVATKSHKIVRQLILSR